MALNSNHGVPLLDDQSIPIIGFGTWQMHDGAAYQAVRDAIEIGYRHIDTATMYENEAEVGRALKDCGVPRDQLYVTTKIMPSDFRQAQRTIDASLRALQLDYVDLWLIHWPHSSAGSTSLWEDMIALRGAGKTTSIGVSNFDISEIDDLAKRTGVMPVVNQIRWSPFVYDANEASAHSERAVVLEGYSPLKASRLDDPTIADIASRYGVTVAQIVMRWHIDHNVVVIPKSVRAERIAENFDVFGFELDAKDVATLDQLANQLSSPMRSGCKLHPHTGISSSVDQ